MVGKETGTETGTGTETNPALNTREVVATVGGAPTDGSEGSGVSTTNTTSVTNGDGLDNPEEEKKKEKEVVNKQKGLIEDEEEDKGEKKKIKLEPRRNTKDTDKEAYCEEWKALSGRMAVYITQKFIDQCIAKYEIILTDEEKKSYSSKRSALSRELGSTEEYTAALNGLNAILSGDVFTCRRAFFNLDIEAKVTQDSLCDEIGKLPTVPSVLLTALSQLYVIVCCDAGISTSPITPLYDAVQMRTVALLPSEPEHTIEWNSFASKVGIYLMQQYIDAKYPTLGGVKPFHTTEGSSSGDKELTYLKKLLQISANHRDEVQRVKAVLITQKQGDSGDATMFCLNDRTTFENTATIEDLIDYISKCKNFPIGLADAVATMQTIIGTTAKTEYENVSKILRAIQEAVEKSKHESAPERKPWIPMSIFNPINWAAVHGLGVAVFYGMNRTVVPFLLKNGYEGMATALQHPAGRFLCASIALWPYYLWNDKTNGAYKGLNKWLAFSTLAGLAYNETLATGIPQIDKYSSQILFGALLLCGGITLLRPRNHDLEDREESNISKKCRQLLFAVSGSGLVCGLGVLISGAIKPNTYSEALTSCARQALQEKGAITVGITTACLAIPLIDSIYKIFARGVTPNV